MKSHISTAAYAASKSLTKQGLTVKRSHISEVMSALLGYRSYAALLVEEADSHLVYHLEDAEFIVLNYTFGALRVRELISLEFQSKDIDIALVCSEALRANIGYAKIFIGMPDFYDSYASEALADAIYNSEDTANVMAGSNAIFPDEPYMNHQCPLTDDLWAAVIEWRIDADGTLSGEYDSDGDRMYNGHKLNCCGFLKFNKAGRAGLILAESGGSAGSDDDWRDYAEEWESSFEAT